MVVHHIITTAYVPGCDAALPHVPRRVPGIPQDRRATNEECALYVSSQALSPANVASLFMHDPSSPRGALLEQWVGRRGESLEAVLVAFGDLDLSRDDREPVALTPWHHLLVIVVKTSSVIMEAQACNIVVFRSLKSLRQKRTTQRLYMMRNVSSTIRSIELSLAGGYPKSKRGGTSTTIAVLCGNLIASMVNVAEKRFKALEMETYSKLNRSNGSYPSPKSSQDEDKINAHPSMEQHQPPPTRMKPLSPFLMDHASSSSYIGSAVDGDTWRSTRCRNSAFYRRNETVEPAVLAQDQLNLLCLLVISQFTVRPVHFSSRLTSTILVCIWILHRSLRRTLTLNTYSDPPQSVFFGYSGVNRNS